MRIIAGRHRGLRLAEVGKGDQAAHLRPTSDRVREALFSVLVGYGQPRGRVLDLFSGTGALGLEALSRGAEHCTFVDNGRVAQGLLRENLKRAGRGDDAQILTCDVERLPEIGEPCDLVFLDPPYGKDLGTSALRRALSKGWIGVDTLVVWEEEAAQEADGFLVQDSRRWGDTWVSFLSLI